MIQQFIPWLLLAAVMLSGCAPRKLGPAEIYYAKKYKVTDASVRRVRSEWDLRFDDFLLSELRNVPADSDIQQRWKAFQDILWKSNKLACRSATGEIHRMPQEALNEMAGLARCQANAEEVVDAYCVQASAKNADRIAKISTADAYLSALDRLMHRIDMNVELKPDEQGRFWRVLLLGWGTIPSLIGIESVENKLEKEAPARLQRTFDHARGYRVKADDDRPTPFLPPVIVQEWPEHRAYDENCDRFGEVFLKGIQQNIQVQINITKPVVYFYPSSAKINGRLYDQMVYVWWYPRYPEMVRNDPAAGNIDGATLRITYDSRHRPAIFEVLQACGCGHQVFVSDSLEKVARKQFGDPEKNKTYSVERTTSGQRNIYVMGLVKIASADMSPIVYVEAGYHSINRIRFDPLDEVTHLYEAGDDYLLASYEELDRLPLEQGVASMFGPDGLVHHSSRKEGLLLAPSGILSAGQPRKRGTQKIRWDEYDFDDPKLLEKTLRLPDDF